MVAYQQRFSDPGCVPFEGKTDLRSPLKNLGAVCQNSSPSEIFIYGAA